MATLTVYAGRAGTERGLAEIEERLASAGEESEQAYPTSASEFLDSERTFWRVGTAVADLLIARDLIRAHADRKLVKVAGRESRRRYQERGVKQRIKNVGWRQVGIRLAGGTEVLIHTPYFRPSRKGLPGRPRGTGKRREGGAGEYPVLELLGITDGVTPLTRSRTSRQVVLCGSYAEAREQLERDGLEMDLSTMVDVAVRTGVKALALRDVALEDARNHPLSERSMVAGKRIRVSVDGGRARIRNTHHKRRKKKNGRRPFELEWREPRIITIDVLDDEGNMDRTWSPIYEVSLGNADDVFALLTGLLRLIGAHQAAEVVFVADGAEWIWARVEQLLKDAEIPRKRVRLILDYYHATEHIGDALKACKHMGNVERRSLQEELSRMLLERNGPQRVVDRLSTLAKGRRAKTVNKEIRYLKGHLDHMHTRYAEMRAAKVPIGSGVVESAVRRVLNLRFKSASRCWSIDHLLPLMYLRALLKSGHWDHAMVAQLERRHWLRFADWHAKTCGQQARKVA